MTCHYPTLYPGDRQNLVMPEISNAAPGPEHPLCTTPAVLAISTSTFHQEIDLARTFWPKSASCHVSSKRRLQAKVATEQSILRHFSHDLPCLPTSHHHPLPPRKRLSTTLFTSSQKQSTASQQAPNRRQHQLLYPCPPSVSRLRLFQRFSQSPPRARAAKLKRRYGIEGVPHSQQADPGSDSEPADNKDLNP